MNAEMHGAFYRTYICILYFLLYALTRAPKCIDSGRSISVFHVLCASAFCIENGDSVHSLEIWHIRMHIYATTSTSATTNDTTIADRKCNEMTEKIQLGQRWEYAYSGYILYIHSFRMVMLWLWRNVLHILLTKGEISQFIVSDKIKQTKKNSD